MLEYFLITIFTLAFAYLCWRKTVWAISFLVFALPSYLIRFEIRGLPMTLLEVMILVLFLIFLIKRLLNKDKSFLQKIGLRGWHFSNYKFLILIILIISTLAAIYSKNSQAAWGIWKAYFLEPILFFIVFINSIKNKKDFNKIITALGLSALVVSIFAIYQKFTGYLIPNENWFNPQTRRVTSFFGYPNAVGLYLAPIVVLYCGKCWLEFCSLYKLVTDKTKKRFERLILFFKKFFHLKNKAELTVTKKVLIIVFNSAVIITGILAIIFAQSEGALVGLAVGLLFLGLLMKPLQKITLIVLVVGILLLIGMPALNNYVIEKATFSDFSGNLRVIIWQETLQMLDNNFLWGGGLANFQNAIKPYHHASHIFEIYLYPHNIILNFWSELGIFGLLAFFLLLVKFFANYLKTKNKDWYKIIICVMIAILVHGIVDVPYFKNDLSVMWWLWFGLSAVLLEQKINKNK